jgi:hypothetical protein
MSWPSDPSGLADPSGLTGLTALMRNRLSELVSLQILRKLELRDVLALRVASRTLNAIVSRMFPTVFPKRRIYLNEILIRETGIWGIDELRTLKGLRELYASGGPVEVYIVAQATKDESAQVHGFPTYSQTELLTKPLSGFISRDDQVHIFLKPGIFIQDNWNFDRLAQFSRNLVSFAFEWAPVKIWQIELLRKTTFSENLRRLCLEGVSLPLGNSETSGRSGKKAKDATNEIRLMLLGLPGLTDLSLARTRLKIKPLAEALGCMTQMVSLDLGRTKLDPNDAANVVSRMIGLRSLKLGGISSVPKILADAVFSLHLTRLVLSQCGITDVRVLTSAALGTGRSSIETLDLTWNRLGSVGDIAALVDALPTLRVIDLQETLRDQDELVNVFIARRSVTANLSFPLYGRLADNTTRMYTWFPDNIRWSPLEHGP